MPYGGSVQTACKEWGGQRRNHSKQSVCSIWYTPGNFNYRRKTGKIKLCINGSEVNARTVVGRFVRKLREEKGLTQEQVANRTAISYQFLSGLENGRENFSIDVLESLAKALGVPLPRLIGEAYQTRQAVVTPRANSKCFRSGVPLPPGMKVEHLEAAINATQDLVARINANLLASGAKPLPRYIQGNNFSGLVSNVLCDALHEHSPYKRNSDQAYPDLINPNAKVGGKPVGLEIKSTIQIGKGGESHNGHSGWHIVACFQTDPASGVVRFVHVMVECRRNHDRTCSESH